MRQPHAYSWHPVPLDDLLRYYGWTDLRVWALLGSWIFIISCTLAVTLQLLPEQVFSGSTGSIIQFFIFNPALIVGILLFFWLGFEWGFIPVFLSSFIIALHSGIPWFWSLIFGIAFVMGIAISAMAYQGFKVSIDLRSFKSVAFYVCIMFIGSIASSLGAFIWSFAHELSAYNTLIIWKSWWSGMFMQALLIIAPLLVLFSPSVERIKRHKLNIPALRAVSVKWVSGAVASITGALALFIFSGRWLGKLRVREVMTGKEAATVADVINALESFELISWISISVILVTGYGAFTLISGWNKQLNNEVRNRTRQLDENRRILQASLDEKKVLLKEIHHRVKNNLALMGGLLELQQRMGGETDGQMNLQTARSRIRSMAMAHEALYQHENLSEIRMKEYITNIANYTYKSVHHPGVDITLHLDLEDAPLEMSKAIPLGLWVNEIIINALKHAFSGRTEGHIWLKSDSMHQQISLTIRDDGVGFSKQRDPNSALAGSLGMTLIKKFAKQLHGSLEINSTPGAGTLYQLRFPSG